MDNLSLTVEPHSFFTLLGPSGCGKSTLLRCIAGLERTDEGDIQIGERAVFSSSAKLNLPTNRRHIGMVFQSYAIWPHMTVRSDEHTSELPSLMRISYDVLCLKKKTP